MMWFSRSLANKVLALIVFSVLAVALVNFTTTRQLSTSLYEFEYVLMDSEIPHERAITGLVIKFKTQVQEWKNVLLRGHETDQRDKYWGRFKKLEAEIQAEANALLSEIEGQPGADQLRSFVRSHQDMAKGYQRGFDAFVASGFVHTVGDAEVKGIDRAPAKTLASAAEILAGHAETATSEVVNDANDAINFSVPLLVVVSLVTISLGFAALRYSFSRPIARLREQLDRYGDGDFSAVVQADSQDEIARIAKNANRMANYVRDMMKHLEETSAGLETTSLNIVTSAGEFERNTDKTNHNLEATQEAMRFMSDSSEQVSGNADAALTAAASANDSARDGLAVMERTAADMDLLATNMRDASGVVGDLDKGTESIGSVLEVIRAIADQTNLLALNAAIEAARAGEQGRGFAVVADEVRQLAMRTQNSIAEIQGIIASLQSDAKQAVKAIDVSSSQTDQCVSQTQSASQSLREITQAVDTILTKNGEIVTSVNSQRGSSQQTSRHIQQTLEVAKSTKALTAEQVRAANELQANAERLVTLTRRIKTA